jgi:GTP cyclohydrolase II
VAAACRLLGIVGPLRLLTNNPEKVAALVADGVEVAGTAPLALAASAYSAHYLAAKSNAGHALGVSSGALPPAAPPEPVEAFAPHAVPGVPHVLRLASYLLPVGEPEPAWFRLHLYFDVDARRERVVLTYRRADARGPVLVRVQAEALLERFPVRVPRLRAEWLAAAARIVAHGAGAVLFTHVLDAEEGDAPPEAAALALLAAHIDGTGARMLAVGERPTKAESRLAAVLAARGATAGPPVMLGD